MFVATLIRLSWTPTIEPPDAAAMSAPPNPRAPAPTPCFKLLEWAFCVWGCRWLEDCCPPPLLFCPPEVEWLFAFCPPLEL
ncbi:UNVERIFIED_ORG: hypothetical protein CLV66_109110 [Actinomadura viridilutea]